MSFQNLIPESEAASLAGVSTTTLFRFAEAGYLQIADGENGMKLFSRNDIEKIFGITAQYADRKIEGAQAAAEPQTTPQTDDVEISLVSEPEPAPSPALSESEEPAQTAQISAFSDQLKTLRSILIHQEKMIDQKEFENVTLREEVKWLRTRIEKLEEKSDRDQLLLMSEAQTIRRLVTSQMDRKSTMRVALEWLGILPPDNNPAKAGTIDLASNQTQNQQQ